jgi:carboxymethylenebutenolidase
MCHDEPTGAARTAAPGEREITITLPSGEEQPALLCGAADDDGDGASRPVVLVLADVYGRSPFYEDLTRRIAEAGFTAVLPDLFFRQGPLGDGPAKDAAFARRRRLDEAAALEDLRAVVGWARAESGAARVGTVGFCMGATWGLDLASLRDDMVTVAYYGFPVPQPTLAAPPPAPLDLVDGQRGPVLAFWGDRDEVVGTAHVEAYISAATRADAAFAAELLPGRGHGFLGEADLDADAEADAATATWRRALAHLREHLA